MGKILLNILRFILAFVFIFSGFVKGIDPWGTAIKLSEYFSAFGFEWLDGGKFFFAVVLSGIEMFLGLALLFRIKEVAVSKIIVWVMFSFTILTLFLAIKNPISDCGCFGDAIKLTPWQTFFKNLILLPISMVVNYVSRRRLPTNQYPIVKLSMTVLLLAVSFGTGIYSYRHIPAIDFLPFRVGVHIPSQSSVNSKKGDVKTTLIYKDKHTGAEKEFALTDTTWYDTSRWEYVDTKVEELSPTEAPKIMEFNIFNSEGDITQELLSENREVFLISMTDPSKVSAKCLKTIAGVIQYSNRHNYNAIIVTPAQQENGNDLTIGDTLSAPIYNIDATVQKSMLRAHNGLILLKEGTILAKWNCRDIPDFNKSDNPIPLSVVVEMKEMWRVDLILIIGFSILALIYVSYITHRSKQ